jgi:hypothetical protein
MTIWTSILVFSMQKSPIRVSKMNRNMHTDARFGTGYCAYGIEFEKFVPFNIVFIHESVFELLSLGRYSSLADSGHGV